CVYSSTSSSMSPVPEQKPMMPAVYPRPSPMSSMYLYCAFQSSEEFSAEDTNCMAMSFLRGSVRSVPPGVAGGPCVGVLLGPAVGLLLCVGLALGMALLDGLGLVVAVGVPPVPLPYTLNSHSE